MRAIDTLAFGWLASTLALAACNPTSLGNNDTTSGSSTTSQGGAAPGTGGATSTGSDHPGGGAGGTPTGTGGTSPGTGDFACEIVGPASGGLGLTILASCEEPFVYHDLAVDDARVYLATEHYLWSLPKDGGPPRLLLPKVDETVVGVSYTRLVIDDQNAYAIRCTVSDGATYACDLVAVPKAGGAGASLLSGLSHDFSALAQDAGNVYVISPSGLVRVPKDGSATTTLWSKVDFPTDLAVDGSYAYWTSTQSFSADVWRLPLAAGAKSAVRIAANADEKGVRIALGAADVFFLTGNGHVYKVPKTAVEAPGTLLATSAGVPTNPSLRVLGQSVFFSIYETGGIWEVSASGGAKSQFVSAAHPGPFMIDLTGTYLVDFRTALRAPAP
jgi:hypothetical protein